MSIESVSTKMLDIGEVLADTFAVVGRTFVILANLAVLLVGIPAAIIIAGAALTPVSPVFAILQLIGVLALLVGEFLVYGAIFQVVMGDLRGQPVSTSLMFKTAARKFWPMVGLAILFASSVIAGSLLLIVPGVILGLAWSVAMPALVLEDRGVFDSLKRSAALTRGKRWSIFLLLFIVWIVLVIVELVLFAIFGGFQGLISRSPPLSFTVVSQLVGVITIPFFAVMFTVLFDHLRGRHGYGAEAVAEVFA
jgi:hypothetical protein